MSEKSESIMGRPTLFTEEMREKILRMAEVGLTDKQMAYICGVTEQTVNNWKVRDSDFFESLKAAKQIADIEVEKMMYRKATGSVTITEKHKAGDGETLKIIEKEIAPDNTAMIFWLKNRQPDKWREKQEITHDISKIELDVDDNAV